MFFGLFETKKAQILILSIICGRGVYGGGALTPFWPRVYTHVPQMLRYMRIDSPPTPEHTQWCMTPGHDQRPNSGLYFDFFSGCSVLFERTSRPRNYYARQQTYGIWPRSAYYNPRCPGRHLPGDALPPDNPATGVHGESPIRGVNKRSPCPGGETRSVPLI